jgi:hypothetical protein
MRNKCLFTCVLLFTPVLAGSSAFAQSTSLNLGARLTVLDGSGSEAAAISGDTVVMTGQKSGDASKSAYVFQRRPGGWVSETQTSTLTPSSYDQYFGSSVAISGDTVVVGSAGKVYIFVKPAVGWRSMHEVAQLTGNFGGPVAIDGDTVVIESYPAALVFVKPAGGWVSTSSYQAKLRPAFKGCNPVPSISGDTVILPCDVGGHSSAVYGFEKPQAGWAAATGQPDFTLRRSHPNSTDQFGSAAAISADKIVVAAPGAVAPNNIPGAIDLYLKPATGWADATETVELHAPPMDPEAVVLGWTSLAVDDSHLVVSLVDQVFVYSEPPSGWASSVWPSQVLVGTPNTDFGFRVALEGDTVVSTAPLEESGGQAQGSGYVFLLFPNWIRTSTDFLEFPETELDTSEILPLTITNTGTGTLNFTTQISSSDYQVLQTSENTGSAGVPAGESCVLPVQFNASKAGQNSDHLTLLSPSSASIRVVALSGTATNSASK